MSTLNFSNNSVTLAMLSFISTTVDDFCVILIFFAREYVKTNRLSHPDTLYAFFKISVGQIFGFTIIVGISLVLGLALHSVVDEEYIDLVGLLPILIGVYKVYEILIENGHISMMYRSLCCMGSREDDSKSREEELATSGEKKPLLLIEDGNSKSLLDVKRKSSEVQQSVISDDPAQIEVILNEESLETLDQVDQSNCCVKFMKQLLCFLDPLVIEVTIYALMFGTDNIAIYVALFSGVSLFESLAVCIFFYSLLLLYLALAILIIVQVSNRLLRFQFAILTNSDESTVMVMVYPTHVCYFYFTVSRSRQIYR